MPDFTELFGLVWQRGGIPLVALVLIAGWCSGLIARECVQRLTQSDVRPTTLPVLGALGGVAPLIGLLGTVVGLVEVFSADVSPDVVAGGIGKALTTTQVGLIIAVPVLLIRQALLRWGEAAHARALIIAHDPLANQEERP